MTTRIGVVVAGATTTAAVAVVSASQQLLPFGPFDMRSNALLVSIGKQKRENDIDVVVGWNTQGNCFA